MTSDHMVPLLGSGRIKLVPGNASCLTGNKPGTTQACARLRIEKHNVLDYAQGLIFCKSHSAEKYKTRPFYCLEENIKYSKIFGSSLDFRL